MAQRSTHAKKPKPGWLHLNLALISKFKKSNPLFSDLGSPSGLPSPTQLPMINRINNAICFLIVAAVFAMIGIEAGNQPGMTHSGTQLEVRK